MDCTIGNVLYIVEPKWKLSPIFGKDQLKIYHTGSGLKNDFQKEPQ